MKEQFKISSYNDRLLVGNLGSFKSLGYKMIDINGHVRNYPGKTIKTRSHNMGYLVICFRRQRYLAHRLIASAFVENKHNYPEVNHINGIKTDNRAFNLEWCTPQQNLKHAAFNLKNGMNYTKIHTENKKIRELFLSKEFSKAEYARSVGISPPTVHAFLKKDLFRRARSLANYFGVNIQDLIDHEDYSGGNEITDSLGGLIWKSRVYKKYSIDELAIKVGCDKDILISIERNEHIPKFETQKKLIEVLDLSEDIFLYDK